MEEGAWGSGQASERASEEAGGWVSGWRLSLGKVQRGADGWWQWWRAGRKSRGSGSEPVSEPVSC